MPQQDHVSALKQTEKPSVSTVSSYTNLYNSHSNTGSVTSLPLSNSNSAIFTNNPGLVQKGTTIANTDHLRARLLHEQATAVAAAHAAAVIQKDTDQSDDDDNSAFELNWQPQVSTDNQYSLS